MKSKIAIIILVILLAISTNYNIKHIKNEKNKENLFFNHVYSNIDQTNRYLKQLQKYYTTGDYNYFDDRYGASYNNLIKNLYLLDRILTDGSLFMNEEIRYINPIYGFEHIGYALEGGLKRKVEVSIAENETISEDEMNQFTTDEKTENMGSGSGVVHMGDLPYGKRYQGSFTEDGVISENEIKFINQLSEDLEELLSTMVGEDGNIKPNLKLKTFRDKLKVFIDEWDIIAERTPSGFSPYDYLLEK